MNRLKKSPLGVAAISVVIAIVLIVLGLMFANPDVCPGGATPEQVAASGCSVGANIGLGLIVLLAIGVAITGFLLAIAIARSNRPPPPPQQPPSAEQPPAPRPPSP